MAIVINVNQEDDWEVVRYVGPINEEAEVHLNKISSTLSKKVKINFKDVSMVNSCGVRSWVNFMREVEKEREVIYTECTSEIVMQINMIPSFKGSAKIDSVYGTYTCESCDNSEDVLFTTGQNLPTTADDEVDPPKCSKCGEEMEMEELEEEFFAFTDVA